MITLEVSKLFGGKYVLLKRRLKNGEALTLVKLEGTRTRAIGSLKKFTLGKGIEISVTLGSRKKKVLNEDVEFVVNEEWIIVRGKESGHEYVKRKTKRVLGIA